MVDQVKRYLGIVPGRRRAIALLLFGFSYLTYGCLLFAYPLPGIAEGFDRVPGTCFVIGAVVAIFGALMARPSYEWVGFSSLYVVSGGWSAQYLFQWIHPGDEPQRPWAGFLVWGLFTGLVVLIAGWAEPVPKHVLAAVQSYLANESHSERMAQGVEDREVRHVEVQAAHDEEVARHEGEK